MDDKLSEKIGEAFTAYVEKWLAERASNSDRNVGLEGGLTNTFGGFLPFKLMEDCSVAYPYPDPDPYFVFPKEPLSYLERVRLMQQSPPFRRPEDERYERMLEHRK